jgi:hypothetical protein
MHYSTSKRSILFYNRIRVARQVSGAFFSSRQKSYPQEHGKKWIDRPFTGATAFLAARCQQARKWANFSQKIPNTRQENRHTPLTAQVFAGYNEG